MNAIRLLAQARQSLETFGVEAQASMAIEECAELIVALRHFRRGRVTVDDVASEIADVLLTCAQMAVLVSPERVERALERKMARLEERLEAHSKGAL